jgi:N-acetylglutamate synthase-like GNAT family acetyltransferase
MAIVYREGHDVDLEQLTALFTSVGWQARVADRARLRQQLVGAMFVVSAWDENVLVGFARAISDGATNAYISTVAVSPAYQGKGIGHELIHRLTSKRQGILFVLHARPEVQPFYLKCGFEQAGTCCGFRASFKRGQRSQGLLSWRI